jgi:ribokinase
MGTGQKPIVVVGSINLDLVAHADHIPTAGETVHGSRFQTHPGGKGANQAVAVARLGYPVQMIGMLGSDAAGQQLRAHLESAGVGLECVGQIEGSSGVAMIVVSGDGDNSIVVTAGANAEVTPDFVDLHIDVIRSAGVVLTQFEIPIKTVQHVADLCFQHQIPLILDPAPAQALPQDLLKRVAWFTPNETEAAFYAARAFNGVPVARSRVLAQRLLAQGAAGVLLKMGPRGAYLATDQLEEQLDAIKVNAVDTTAAGDAFNGAFAVGLLLGKSPIESARFAIAAAAFSVTRAGAQPSMPVLHEVERLLGSELSNADNPIL